MRELVLIHRSFFWVCLLLGRLRFGRVDTCGLFFHYLLWAHPLASSTASYLFPSNLKPLSDFQRRLGVFCFLIACFRQKFAKNRDLSWVLRLFRSRSWSRFWVSYLADPWCWSDALAVVPASVWWTTFSQVRRFCSATFFCLRWRLIANFDSFPPTQLVWFCSHLNRSIAFKSSQKPVSLAASL